MRQQALMKNTMLSAPDSNFRLNAGKSNIRVIITVTVNRGCSLDKFIMGNWGVASTFSAATSG